MFRTIEAAAKVAAQSADYTSNWTAVHEDGDGYRVQSYPQGAPPARTFGELGIVAWFVPAPAPVAGGGWAS